MELDKIARAFVAAQAEIGGVEKDSKNPAFKSRYASLEAVIDAAKPVLIKHKLAFLQMPGALTEHGLSVTTMILHESGQHISSTLTVPLAKRDPQGAGSAITYACRYSLMAMLGMPPVDDDGEAAMDRHPPRQEAKQYSPPAEITRPPAIPFNTAAPTGVNPDLWATAYSRAESGTAAFTAWAQNDATTSEKAMIGPFKVDLWEMAKAADAKAQEAA